MATSTPARKYMTADEFFNPSSFPARRSREAAGLFDRAGETKRTLPSDDHYDGTNFGPRVQRPVAIVFGNRNKTLANPHAIYGADGYTRGHALLAHYERTMLEGGADALRLFRELAKEGQRASAEANTATARPDSWVAVGQTLEEARVGRAAVTAALEQAPAELGVARQMLPRRLDEVDVGRFLQTLNRAAALEPLRPRIHDPDAKPSLRVAGTSEAGTHAGVVGVVWAKGKEALAADYVAGLGDNVIVAATPTPALQKELDARGDAHLRINPVPADAKGGKALGAFLDGVDKIAVLGDDKRTRWITAEASRAGKLGRVVGNDGTRLDTRAAAVAATREFAPWREQKQEEAVSKMGTRSSTPEARLLLSLAHADQEARMTPADIDQVAALDRPLGEIVDIARTEQGRASLRDDDRIHPRAIRLLGNPDAMTKAQEATTRIVKHCRDYRTTIVAPEGYPDTLRNDPDRPAVLFVQGDATKLAHAGRMAPTMSMVGTPTESGFEQRMSSSMTSNALAGLSEARATLVRAEGSMTVTPDPKATDQILVLASGAGHHASDAQASEREAVLANGGLVVSAHPPLDTGVVRVPEFKTGPKGKKEKTFVERPKMTTPNESTARSAAALAASLSQATVVATLDPRRESTATHRAAEAALTRKRPLVVLRANDEGAARGLAGNRALLSGRGQEALRKAGISATVAENVAGAGKPLDGAPVAIDSGPDHRKAMVAMAEHLRGNGASQGNPKSRATQRDAALEVEA